MLHGVPLLPRRGTFRQRANARWPISTDLFGEGDVQRQVQKRIGEGVRGEIGRERRRRVRQQRLLLRMARENVRDHCLQRSQHLAWIAPLPLDVQKETARIGGIVDEHGTAFLQGTGYRVTSSS